MSGGPCRVYDSNLRVKVPNSPLYVYPDVTVVCGPTQHDPADEKKQTVINPTLVVEVLSELTKGMDAGFKFWKYVESDMLSEYVLVGQYGVHVQSHFRQGDGTWLLTPVIAMDGVAKFRSLGIEIPVAEIYAGVAFEEPPVWR